MIGQIDVVISRIMAREFMNMLHIMNIIEAMFLECSSSNFHIVQTILD